MGSANFDFSRRRAIALDQGSASGLGWSRFDSGFWFHGFECKDLNTIGRTKEGQGATREPLINELLSQFIPSLLSQLRRIKIRFDEILGGH